MAGGARVTAAGGAAGGEAGPTASMQRLLTFVAVNAAASRRFASNETGGVTVAGSDASRAATGAAATNKYCK